MLFLTLLNPQEKIDSERKTLKFERIIAKLNLYVTENASFLEFSPVQIAVACLLLTMKYCDILKFYGTNLSDKKNSPT